MQWARALVFGAPPVRLTVHLDRDSLTAATMLTVELELESSADVRAHLPKIVPVTNLVLRSWTASPPEPVWGGGYRERGRAVMEPTIPGVASVGPIVVTYEEREGDQWIGRRLQTDRIDIPVGSLGVPETGPIEFKPPRGPAWPRPRVLPSVITVVLGLAAVFAAVYWWSMRRARKASVPLPPNVIALRELGELERRDLLRRGEVKRFYEELTDIIRRYLEGGFGVPALELTTEELLRRLGSGMRLPADQASTARALFEDADLVKFAKHRPDLETAENHLRDARAFVRATSPTEEPARAV